MLRGPQPGITEGLGGSTSEPLLPDTLQRPEIDKSDGSPGVDTASRIGTTAVYDTKDYYTQGDGGHQLHVMPGPGNRQLVRTVL